MKIEIPNDLYFRNKYLGKIREFYYKTDIIKVITGIRGCGKTSLIRLCSSGLSNS